MNKKIWLLGIVVLVFALAAAGIAAHHARDNGVCDEAPIEPGETEGEVPFEKIEPGTEQGVEETVEGTFVGFADNHTVEINVNGQYKAFALYKGDVTGELQEGDRIKIDYEAAANGRLVITHLEILDRDPGKNTDQKETKEDKETDADTDVFQAEGILTGRIDSHSVEIEVEGQLKAFGLSDTLRKKEFAPGEINFTYYVDPHGRSIIIDADYQEPRQSEVHTAEGTFLGLADNHTAELEVDGTIRAFGLDDHISFAGIEEGEEIFFAYQENEQGRLVIIKIEKLF